MIRFFRDEDRVIESCFWSEKIGCRREISRAAFTVYRVFVRSSASCVLGVGFLVLFAFGRGFATISFSFFETWRIRFI